jgi:fatty acid desaturase
MASSLGGLVYQMEHYLFPNMPRPNLRRAQPLVRAFCRQHDITYTEALRHLHSVGASLRRAAATD